MGRLKDLRRAAAVNRWGCDHARTPQLFGFKSCDDAELEALSKHAATQTWRRMAAQELADRHRPCPPCLNQNRRNAKHWSALFLVGFVLLVLGLTTTCAARARGGEPCAPYSPVDGYTCEPPTSFVLYKGLPVCACRSKRMADR